MIKDWSQQSHPSVALALAAACPRASMSGEATRPLYPCSLPTPSTVAPFCWDGRGQQAITDESEARTLEVWQIDFDEPKKFKALDQGQQEVQRSHRGDRHN